MKVLSPVDKTANNSVSEASLPTEVAETTNV